MKPKTERNQEILKMRDEDYLTFIGISKKLTEKYEQRISPKVVRSIYYREKSKQAYNKAQEISKNGPKTAPVAIDDGVSER